jgi:hypothetical protein
MTRRPPLRLARPGQLPAPAAGQDSLQVLDEAIDQLARASGIAIRSARVVLLVVVAVPVTGHPRPGHRRPTGWINASCHLRQRSSTSCCCAYTSPRPSVR